MPVVTTNLAVGPGDLYTAEFGFDDSLIVAGADPDTTDLTYMGATDDGLNITVAKSYANHSVDQTADWVASTITERSARLEVNLAEPTMDNLKLALNGGTTASVNASWDRFEPETDLVGVQEKYIAIVMIGNTLGGKKIVTVLRKALNVDDVAWAYKKDAKTMYACSWASHYISASIAPFAVYTQK